MYMYVDSTVYREKIRSVLGHYLAKQPKTDRCNVQQRSGWFVGEDHSLGHCDLDLHSLS